MDDRTGRDAVTRKGSAGRRAAAERRAVAERRVAPDPRPLGGLADLADLMGGESERSRRFLGGLIAGALAGAAIAGAVGAAIMRRRNGAGR